MCIKDVVHSCVMQSNGGIAALAARMRIPYSTLKSKLNPNCDTHHLYVEDLERIVDLVDTDEVAMYFAAQRDGIFVKSHQIDGVSDMELLDLFLEREERYGKFARSVRSALEDGQIDAREFEEMMRLFDEVSSVREQIRARLKSLFEQSRARAEKRSMV